MNRSRMLELIAAYGADRSRWPPAARREADSMSGSDLDWQSALVEARALDAALAELPAPGLPAGLAERILAQAERANRAAEQSAPATRPEQAPARNSRFGWRALVAELGGLRLAGPAFACALSLGLGLSWLLPAPTESTYSESDLDTYLALVWMDEGFDEELP